MIWRRLLLALPDLETAPSYVFDRVGRLARAFDAHVDLFHCLYEPRFAAQSGARDQAAQRIAEHVQERHRRLERLADILREQGVTVSASVHWDHPVYEAVIRQALRYKADVLIAPALSPHEPARTVAYREQRLIEQAPCAVLLLRTQEVFARGGVVAEVDPRHARDGDVDLDEIVIGAAKTLAGALGDVPVHLHHAAPLGEEGVGTHARGASSEPRVRRLAELHSISAGQACVEYGDPGTTLPTYVRSVRAQTLVIGVGPLARRAAVLGERLAESIECDLLVVKSRYEHPAVGSQPSPAVLPQPL